MKLEHGDRVTLDGRAATVVSPHKGSVTVLPDDRPRSAGAETWAEDRIPAPSPVTPP